MNQEPLCFSIPLPISWLKTVTRIEWIIPTLQFAFLRTFFFDARKPRNRLGSLEGQDFAGIEVKNTSR